MIDLINPVEFSKIPGLVYFTQKVVHVQFDFGWLFDLVTLFPIPVIFTTLKILFFREKSPIILLTNSVTIDPRFIWVCPPTITINSKDFLFVRHNFIFHSSTILLINQTQMFLIKFVDSVIFGLLNLIHLILLKHTDFIEFIDPLNLI